MLGKGGIVADGMGLGELTAMALPTLQAKPSAFCLWCWRRRTTRPQVAKRLLLVSLTLDSADWTVCPLSVVSNWEKQIHDHVSSGRLTSYTYHGANRDVASTTLLSYDVGNQILG